MTTSDHMQPATKTKKRFSLRLSTSKSTPIPADNDHDSLGSLSSSSSSSSSDEDSEAEHEEQAVESARNTGNPAAADNTSPSDQKSQDQGSNAHSARKPRPLWQPHNRFDISNAHAGAKGKVSKRDGRLKIRLYENPGTNHIGQALSRGLQRYAGTFTGPPSKSDYRVPTFEESEAHQQVTDARLRTERTKRPKMDIVIMVIGSRGDIQPFVKIGKILKEEYGHRVRLATHPSFRDFVEKENGLELFSVGGDPSELMAFMVKNPGLIPSLESVKKGEIGKRRSQMYEMFEGFWRACIEPHDGHDKTRETEGMPFFADAIIANPPSFAHVHCAERLGCPLHLMFTFPYTPTQQFPHPLANIKKTNVDPSYVNLLSYPIVEMMVWQGLGDLVNRFRVGTLGLDPVSTIWAPGQLQRLKIPFTYMWSPSLVPKPTDWNNEIDIAGFVFLELASSFKPPDDLSKFLDEGEPPVYIGFGSIVVDDPSQFTQLIFKAIKDAGVRAVINQGWGHFGDKDNTPEGVFMIDNVPHDWLFPRCKAVIHHGGAGTTAIGLKLAKPTLIVPFFGDQPFWGAMVAAAKAGAHECIPYKALTAEKLAEGIKQCLTEEAQENVQKIADSIADEGDGARNAVKSFHAHLPLNGHRSMRCGFLEDRAAAWQSKRSGMRLSTLAVELLIQQKKLGFKDVKLIRQYDWNDFQGPPGPLTGLASGVLRSVTGFGKGLGEGPVLMGRDIHKHAHYERRKIQKKIERKRAQKVAGMQAEASDAKDADGGRISGREMQEMDKLPESTQKAGTLLKDLRQNVTDPDQESSEEQQQQQQPQNDDAAKRRTKLQRGDTQRSIITTASHTPQNHVVVDVARDVLQGAKKSAGAVAKAPMEILLGIGQGLHNLPRIYHDETVRRPKRIQGLHSGLVAAREALIYESYDGITGIVKHPYEGARSSGAKGFASGVGKGLGGFIIKESAAIVNPIAFTMKGVHREATKHRTPLGQMRATRVRQGRAEYLELSGEQRERMLAEVLEGYRTMKELRKARRRMKRQGWGGIKGHIEWEKEKKEWYRYGAFQSVQVAHSVLEARKKGIAFERFMAEADGQDGHERDEARQDEHN